MKHLFKLLRDRHGLNLTEEDMEEVREAVKKDMEYKIHGPKLNVCIDGYIESEKLFEEIKNRNSKTG